MSRIIYDLDIDVKLLKQQIKAVLESNMPEAEKAGVHNLLGCILDVRLKPEFFHITSVCKDDLIEVFKGNKKALSRIQAMNEADMSYLSEKLASDYCEQLYWSSLKIIFEDRFMEVK